MLSEKSGIWSAVQTPKSQQQKIKQTLKSHRFCWKIRAPCALASWTTNGPVKICQARLAALCALCSAAIWFSARAFFIRCSPDGMRSTSTGCQKHLAKSHSVKSSWVNLKVLNIFLHHLNDRRHSDFIASKDCRLQVSSSLVTLVQPAPACRCFCYFP